MLANEVSPDPVLPDRWSRRGEMVPGSDCDDAKGVSACAVRRAGIEKAQSTHLMELAVRVHTHPVRAGRLALASVRGGAKLAEVESVVVGHPSLLVIGGQRTNNLRGRIALQRLTTVADIADSAWNGWPSVWLPKAACGPAS